MTSRMLCLGALLTGVVLAGGCDKSQDAPPSFNAALGGAGTGAPFYMPPPDAGILKDQSAYQPARPGGGGGSRSSDSGGAGGSGEAAVRKVVTDMIFAAIHGDIDTMLDAFNPEHVAALKDNSEARSVLHDTYGKIDALVREVASKLGKEFDLKSLTAENYKEMLKNLGPEAEKIDLDQLLVVELQDPTSATVSIKLPATIPTMPPDAAKSPSIPVLKQDGQWRVQAEPPLTEQQVVEMVAGLKVAQKFLDKLLSKLVEAQITTAEELNAFFQQQFMVVMAEVMAETAMEESDAADAKEDGAAEKKPGEGEPKPGEGGAEGGGDTPPPAPSGGGRTRDPRRTPP